MVKSLIINSSHYIGNSTFRYPLRTPMKCPDDVSHIFIVSCLIYNNTFNISSLYGNNTLSLNWLGTTYNLTFPNGYYAASDINSYIQSYCYTNGLYMTTSAGNIVYFIECVVNAVRYAISLNLYYIPTSANATTLLYSIPSGSSWTFPSTNSTPQVTFNTVFGSLIGQISGTYPPTVLTTNIQYVSTTTPIISPVNAYVICVNILNNPYSNPNNILFTLPLNNSFGGLVTSTPMLVWNEIYSGQYSEFTLTIFDQNMNILSLNDTEIVIQLAFSKLDPKTGYIS